MKKITVTFLWALALTTVCFSSAYARPPYTDDFNAFYGTDGTDRGTTLGSCITCHNTTGGDGYNPYGLDFLLNGKNFTAIEPLDSDGDGFDNLTEIIEDTFPGDPDSIPANPTNNPPIADGGADQTVSLGDTVTLDGSGSHDVDGDQLTLAWSFVSTPAGSSATLSNSTVVNPTFVADLPGTYMVQLTVNDGMVDSIPDTVMISMQNSVPVADAGPDQSILLEETVTLDGSGSHDVDGDQLTMTWSFVSIPAGSSATLSDPTAVSPTFVVDLPGTYVVQLTVNDGMVDSASDRVTISTQNSAPVADAGPDQRVSAGDTVTLDGTGSSDPDGDALTFSWSFVSRPATSGTTLSDTTAAQPDFSVDLPGTYVVQLIVKDSALESAADTLTISTENSSPTADAGDDRTAQPGETVTLDGSRSQDADGDPLTFVWSFVSVPSGSTATLSDPTTVKPAFVADVSGTYVLQLIVNDGKVDSTADTVSISTGISTANSAPVAEAGKRHRARVGDTVTLDGSQSSDPDGDTLTFSWSFASRPENSIAPLAASASPAGAATFAFVPDVPGTYVVQLIVNDGTLASEPDTCTVKVRKQNRKGGKGGRRETGFSSKKSKAYSDDDLQNSEDENEHESEHEHESD